MRVVSTNIAEPRTIQWQGRDVLTGIYKEPTNQPISLDIENVVGDEVSDRRVHGGIFKACYLFASDDYPYWKNLYPTLDWNWGMFGENLSVQGLNLYWRYIQTWYSNCSSNSTSRALL
jgi:MOSC domain-containing protein YiiM